MSKNYSKIDTSKKASGRRRESAKIKVDMIPVEHVEQLEQHNEHLTPREQLDKSVRFQTIRRRESSDEAAWWSKIK